jgi:hypothetical protein
MLELLKKHLDEVELFKGDYPEIVYTLIEAIPNQELPVRMKEAIVLSQIMLFVSQFQRNIRQWTGSLIPVNAITFCIAKSGLSKDSSVAAVKKCFNSGYEIINEHRWLKAKEIAINKARGSKKANPELWSVYKDFYFTPNPLFSAPSTLEGFTQHLNNLEDTGLGAGYIYSGEIGAELAQNYNLIENIRLISELYDEGYKEIKVLKTREIQTKEIKNLPVSALFMGSPDNLLFEDSIKKKFKTEFTTKLARRSFFIYIDEEIASVDYKSVKALIEKELIHTDTVKESIEDVNSYIRELTRYMLSLAKTPIEIAPKVRELYIAYKRYNEELSQQIENHYPIYKLTRAHLQWKALKLAGAFCLVQGSDIITVDDYKAAVKFVETIESDILRFEKELDKEPYELFASYVKSMAVNDEMFVPLHQLKKQGYVSSGNLDSHIKDLIMLVSSYDNEGIYYYTQQEGSKGIAYQKLNSCNEVLVSYVKSEGTKIERARKSTSGFICEAMLFKDLEKILSDDYTYSPFKFINGIRGRDNIDSFCKWIALDIDNSTITDIQAHALLSDINHFIVRTSNKDNPYKFRLLIEFDMQVNIPDNCWLRFLQSISQEIGIAVDILPKSQIFYSYKDREILKETEADCFPIKKHVTYVMNEELLKEEKPYTSPQKKALLADPINTFAEAFYAKQGEGSRKMIIAARKAKELGADKEYIIELMNKINDFWVLPMEQSRFEQTILEQIKRW